MTDLRRSNPQSWNTFASLVKKRTYVRDRPYNSCHQDVEQRTWPHFGRSLDIVDMYTSPSRRTAETIKSTVRIWDRNVTHNTRLAEVANPV